MNGSLKELNGSKAIPVDKCEKGLIGEFGNLTNDIFLILSFIQTDKNTDELVTNLKFNKLYLWE